MSTIAQEPTYGAPQSQAGAELTGGAQAQLDPNAEYNRQMAEYNAKMAIYNAQQAAQQPQAQPAQQEATPAAQQHYVVPEAQHAAQGMPQIGNVNPTVNMPGQMPAQELPSIPDNNPVAELPQTYQAPQYGQPEQAHVGMPAQPQMQPQYNPAQGMSAQPAQPAQPQYGQAHVGMPAQPQMQPQYNPAQGMPAQPGQPQYGQAPGMPAQPQYNPAQGMPVAQPMPGAYPGMPGMPGQPAQPQYGQAPGMPAQPQYQQPVPGGTAPGYSANSYLQQQGGMFGPTPTGHPEKQKFQGQAILVFVKNRLTKKNTTITTGLLNPNMADRNGKAANFVCFSGSAAKQIDIIENPQVRPQYTNIEKASGQIVAFEGSWEWNDKGKEPGWQLMMDNFTFVNDPNLRQHAETYVPPVPPSPMDMLNGGMMNGGMMQPQYQAPAAGYGQPVPPQYGQAPGMPGMPAYPAQTPMGGQYNPHQGMPAYPAQPQPGQPGMPAYPAQPGMQPYPGMPAQ